MVFNIVFLSFYGIWNLEFFRPFYSNLYLGIGELPALALDYAIALYPFLLNIIAYFLIVLYNKRLPSSGVHFGSYFLSLGGTSIPGFLLLMLLLYFSSYQI